MEGIFLILLMLIGLALELAFIGLTIYGICVCFKRKWYFGLISLVLPLFGTIVGTAKLFKKDLLV